MHHMHLVDTRRVTAETRGSKLRCKSTRDPVYMQDEQFWFAGRDLRTAEIGCNGDSVHCSVSDA